LRRLSLAKSPYHHYLVEDENFRRWVEALERGSITTASNYFRKSVSFERSPASFSKPQSGLGIHTSHSAALMPSTWKIIIDPNDHHFRTHASVEDMVAGIAAVLE